MKPYNSELIYGSDEEDKQIDYPVFTWDYYQIGGRYKAELKLKVDEEGSANREYYNWGYYDRQDRNGRLFLSSLLSTLKENITPKWMYHEEDWFMNMGFGDGYILVDGAKQSDVLNINKLDVTYVFFLTVQLLQEIHGMVKILSKMKNSMKNINRL